MASKKAKAIVWKAILDDPVHPVRLIFAASSRSEAMQYLNGSGEVLYLKPFEDFWVDSSELYKTLSRAGWGQDEIAVILSALSNYLSEDFFHA